MGVTRHFAVSHFAVSGCSVVYPNPNPIRNPTTNPFPNPNSNPIPI